MDEEGNRSHHKMIALCMRIEQHRIIIYRHSESHAQVCEFVCVVLENSENLLRKKIITEEEIITHCCVPHPLIIYHASTSG